MKLSKKHPKTGKVSPARSRDSSPGLVPGLQIIKQRKKKKRHKKTPPPNSLGGGVKPLSITKRRIDDIELKENIKILKSNAIYGRQENPRSLSQSVPSLSKWLHDNVEDVVHYQIDNGIPHLGYNEKIQRETFLREREKDEVVGLDLWEDDKKIAFTLQEEKEKRNSIFQRIDADLLSGQSLPKKLPLILNKGMILGGLFKNKVGGAKKEKILQRAQSHNMLIQPNPKIKILKNSGATQSSSDNILVEQETEIKNSPNNFNILGLAGKSKSQSHIDIPEEKIEEIRSKSQLINTENIPVICEETTEESQDDSILSEVLQKDTSQPRVISTSDMETHKRRKLPDMKLLKRKNTTVLLNECFYNFDNQIVKNNSPSKQSGISDIYSQNGNTKKIGDSTPQNSLRENTAHSSSGSIENIKSYEDEFKLQTRTNVLKKQITRLQNEANEYRKMNAELSDQMRKMAGDKITSTAILDSKTVLNNKLIRQQPSTHRTTKVSVYTLASEALEKEKIVEKEKVMRERLRKDVKTFTYDIERYQNKLRYNTTLIFGLEKKLHLLKPELKALCKQQSEYYHNILQQGCDTRNIGMSWVIKIIWELGKQVNPKYSPYFLDNTSFNYILKTAKLELRLDEVQKEHSSLQKVKKKKIEQEKRIDKSKEAHMRNDIKFPDIGIVKSRIHFAVQRVAVNGKVFANKYDSPLNVKKYETSENESVFSKNEEYIRITEIEKGINKIRTELKSLRKEEMDRLTKLFMGKKYFARSLAPIPIIIRCLVGEDETKKQVDKFHRDKTEHFKHNAKNKTFSFGVQEHNPLYDSA